MPTAIDLFEKARRHERLEQLQRRARARPAAVLPGGGGRARPGRPDGGPRADHARLEQLPRAHRRRARQGRRPRRARALRHRPHRLALHERHHAAAPRARARAGRLDGHRGRARLHDRLPGQHRLRSARCWTRATRSICDSGDHASILDAVVDVAGPRPAVPPQPARQARVDAVARRVRRRRRARRGGRRVLDGGRPGAAAGRDGALPRARRAPDGRRGARASACWASAATGACELLDVRGRGGPAHGHLLQVARLLRRLHRGPARRDRLPARPVALVHVHRRGRAGRHRAPRSGALRIIRSDEGAGADGEGARQRPLPARRARASSATG